MGIFRKRKSKATEYGNWETALRASTNDFLEIWVRRLMLETTLDRLEVFEIIEEIFQQSIDIHREQFMDVMQKFFELATKNPY